MSAWYWAWGHAWLRWLLRFGIIREGLEEDIWEEAMTTPKSFRDEFERSFAKTAFDKWWESRQVLLDDRTDWSNPECIKLLGRSKEVLEFLKFEAAKAFYAGWEMKP